MEKLRSRWPALPELEREKLRRQPWQVKVPANLQVLDCLQVLSEVGLNPAGLRSRRPARFPLQAKRLAKLQALNCLRGMLEVALNPTGLRSRQAARFPLRANRPVKLRALNCLRVMLVTRSPKRLGSRQALPLPSQRAHSFQCSPSPDPTSFCQA